MKRSFAATVWCEGKAYVSQCLELDIASQGETEGEALANLTEALELYFEPPQATRPPRRFLMYGQLPETAETKANARTKMPAYLLENTLFAERPTEL